MSHQRYPRAVDLAQMAHCSVCGETNPITDDGGDTTCCARRECPGMGPEAQDVCCQALQDRVDHEAAYGTPASPVRSTWIDETQGLRTPNGVCNTGVTPGGAEPPTTTDPKEPTMALSTAAATSAVCRNLFKDAPNSFEPVGFTFGKDRQQYEEMAKAYLGDKTRLSGSTIDGADWDEVFATFVEGKYDAPAAAPITPELPAASRVTTPENATGTTTNEPALTPVGWVVSVQYDAEFAHLAASGGADYIVSDLTLAPAAAPAPAPAAPAAPRKAAREALGASSATGWDLLYDKPKAGAEVGRRYVDGKPEYALICKTHGHAHGLARLSDEGPVRKAGGWCPSC